VRALISGLRIGVCYLQGGHQLKEPGVKKRIAGVFALMGLLIAGNAAADGFAIGVKAGTLGLGIEGTFGLSERFNLRAGVNNYSYDFDETASDIRYDTELDLQSGSLLLDWHPFAGVFRISAGYVHNKNALSLRAAPAAGTTVNIGGQDFDGSQVGILTGDVTFKKNVPYAGIGWGNAVRGKGLGFSFEIGAVFQDEPTVRLASTSSNTALQARLPTEEQQAQEDLDDFKTYPVISFGLSYHF
jgi:hypothetical protein